MTIADKAVLVTGANRGIGQALIAVHCQCRIRNWIARDHQEPQMSNVRVFTKLTLDRGSCRHRAGSMMVRSHQLDCRSAKTGRLRGVQ
jgi:NAD(P)-dependent dehydrogenase (short-subunit alcohol dehydrogenase family)